MIDQTDSHRIRLARQDEVPRLREVEDEAGTLFSGLGLIDEALDVSFPVEDLIRLVGMGQVWVACRADDLPVGIVIASVREGAVYVEEIDVLPAHGRHGIGARLLATVCAWAQAHGHPAVTLSTFRDVPWNGPFYRKHGFTDLQPGQWTPGMRAIRDKEARHGLDVEARVFMRRELGPTATATERTHERSPFSATPPWPSASSGSTRSSSPPPPPPAAAQPTRRSSRSPSPAAWRASPRRARR